MTERRREYLRKYNKKYKIEHKERRKKYHKKVFLEWSRIFPHPTYCEICRKKLKLNSGDTNTSIHFDHRNEGKEPIKGCPTVWLREHKRTPKTEAIWKSCDFGILCLKCNSDLPTKNRKQWYKRLGIYINKRG